MGGTINEQYPVGVTREMVLEQQIRDLKAELDRHREASGLVLDRNRKHRNKLIAERDALRAELAAAKEERDQLAAHVERLEKAIDPMARAYRVSMAPFDHLTNDQGAAHCLPWGWPTVGDFAEANSALAATPAQSLEAAIAPLMAHVERLEKALKPFANECDETEVEAHNALQFGGYLPIDQPDLSIDGWAASSLTWKDLCAARAALNATPAQSLAAHDAALLREVAGKLDGDGLGANQYYRNWLLAEADRIEKGQYAK